MKSRLIVILLVLVLVPSGMTVVAEDKAGYSGIDSCKMCHGEKPEFIDWAKTSHATSFELLVNVGQEKNAECLPCHTTGYGAGGYVDEKTTPGLKGVTCEACHGPGANHTGGMGDKTKIQRVPSAKTCSACHQKTSIHSLSAK